MEFFLKIIFFITKQISRVVYRLPRPSHLAKEYAYKRISKVLRARLGDGSKILVIGGVRKSDYKYFLSYFNAICIDLEIKERVDLVTDAHFLPFRNNSYSGVILQAVIQCVNYPDIVIDEIYRVLKHGGLIYGGIPLCQQECPAPVDLWRWTEEGTKRLFHRFKEVEIGIAAGPFFALFDIILSVADNLTEDKDCNFVLWYFSLWFFYPLKILDTIFSKNKRLLRSSAAIYYIGEK